MKILNNNINKSKTDYLPIWIYIGVQVCISIILEFLLIVFKLPNELITTLQSFIPSGIIFITLIIIYYKRLKNDFLNLKKKDFLSIFIITILLIAINYGLSVLFESFNIKSDNQEMINNMFLNYKLLISLDVVLFAPFIEEFVFRYSIDSACKKNLMFLILSSIIFGIMHGINITIIIYIFIGLVLSYSYLKYNRNIIIPIIIHMLNNLFAIITMFLSL